MRPETCAHENYGVLVAAKTNSAFDICKCDDCGAVAHRVPFFVPEHRYKMKHVG